MITVRRSEDRGHANRGWLDTHHTFSFADYYDPKFTGFRSLRVINEDRVAPGAGFGTHGHRDMEILTYVLEGSIVHRDSMGHEKKLGPNEIQRMSAGTGVMHSEYNASKSDPLHFFQIWIEPLSQGTQPSYEQLRFHPEEKRNRWKHLAGPTGGNGAARINQDAHMFVAEMTNGTGLRYGLDANRSAWVHAVRGEVTVNGVALHTGDAAAITGESDLEVSGGRRESNELLLFDLA
jgi:redox-sensitive bicupin YhaK (pirin superfamily)